MPQIFVSFRLARRVAGPPGTKRPVSALLAGKLLLLVVVISPIEGPCSTVLLALWHWLAQLSLDWTNSKHSPQRTMQWAWRWRLSRPLSVVTFDRR